MMCPWAEEERARRRGDDLLKPRSRTATAPDSLTLLHVDRLASQMWGEESGKGTGSPESTRSEPPHNFTSSLSQGKSVVRPLAFRPVGLAGRGNGHLFGSTPLLSRPSHSLSRSEVHAISSSERCSPETGLSCNCSLASQDRSDGWGSVVELETALRRRESEVQALRQTMEANEAAILHVYQEKERAWEREASRLRRLHAARLATLHQRSRRLEHALVMHTYTLQEDKKRLEEETSKLEQENRELRSEVEAGRLRLEDTEWALCQKSGELALAKSQLKEAQAEQANKSHELISLRNQVRQLTLLVENRESELSEVTSELDKLENKLRSLDLVENEIPASESANNSKILNENKRGDASTSPSLTESPLEGDLREQILLLSKQLVEERTEWERERTKWSLEKEKVLSYQRQLQLNYVQMYKRNCMLEERLGHLELEGRSGRKVSQTVIQL